MNIPIPNKRVCYIKVPSQELLANTLDRKFPAMPTEIRTQAILGWTKAVERTGGRNREGLILDDWLSSFCTYSNACWANSRLKG
jgi:hypothetical protein